MCHISSSSLENTCSSRRPPSLLVGSRRKGKGEDSWKVIFALILYIAGT